MLKSVLRRQLRASLSTLSREERRAQSLGATRALTTVIEQARAERPDDAPVALFVSMDSEIDTAPLDAWLRERRIGRVVPTIAGDDLVFRRVDDALTLEELPVGVFNIRAPGPEAPELGLEQCAVVVCPGLAFDRTGGRLGLGRGFYDRALGAARARGPVFAVGFGLDLQEVEAVPTDARDAPLDGLVTPSRGFRRCR